MTARRRLPNRRDSRIVTFTHDGIPFSAGYSYEPGTFDLAEVFIHPQLPSSQIHEICASLSAVTSVAFQHGAPLHEIKATLPKHANNAPTCVMGAALNAIAKAAEDERKELAEAG